MTEYADAIDEQFDFLIDARPGKPRERGLTFVQADGPFYAVTDASHLRGVLAYAGEWIDWYKFTVGSHIVQPPDLVAEKLALLDAHDVEAFPGGNLLEDAAAAGEATACLEALREVGFPRLEVSATTPALDRGEQVELIERATEMGFTVHGEVGRKRSGGEKPLSVERVAGEMERCLGAGADRVIFESDAFEAAFADATGVDRELAATIDAIVDAVGADRVIFEVPLTGETAVLEAVAWLITNVGPGVNLGNVNPNYINLVEQMRRGLGPRVD